MKRLITFCIFIFLAASAVKIKASHMMGSDITYKCLGNGKYEVTVTVYRDCNGIPLQASNLDAKCTSGTGNASFNLPKIAVNDVTNINPNCPNKSRCQGAFPYGIEEHIFKGIIDLSALN